MAESFDSPLGREYFQKGSNGRGVLFLHGFTATPGMLRPQAEHMAAAGFTVHAPLLIGHGSTLRQMEQANWGIWLKQATRAFVDLADSCSRVSVVGHSMGGLLALILAQRLPVDKLILIAAPLRFYDGRISFAKWLWPLKRARPWGKDDAPVLRPDCMIGYDAFPVRKLWDLQKLSRVALKDLKHITCDTLIVQPRHDTATHLDSAEMLYRGINSQNKKILWLEESIHGCTLGIEMDLLNRKIGEFLR